jgi:hypothetical protein
MKIRMLPAMLLAAALLLIAPLGAVSFSLGTVSLGTVHLGARPAFAHPALERGRVNIHTKMKGPGPGSARRKPLSTVAVKTYLPRKAGESSGAGTPVLQGLLGFYRSVISPVDGNRCVMAPTCSLYSHQAIAEHGVIMGIFLTADRLLHEGDDIPRVPRISEGGETLYVDTLEANTYWWPGWMK